MSIMNAGRRGLFGLLLGAPVAVATARAAPAAKAVSDRAVTGCELGTALCETFGIAPDMVSRVSIECAPGDIAKVSIERLVSDSETKMLKRMADLYGLHRVGR